MSTLDWAREEVRIACEKENPNRKEGEFDHGCACYESALKAYELLCNEGHDGYGFSITRSILERLMYGNPLTPIEDKDDSWNDVTYNNEFKEYQCKRKSSLFKKVYSDGRIKYTDIDRYYAYNKETNSSWKNGLVSEIVHEMFPITFPYYSSKPWKVNCMDFLTDKKNGDFDTYAIFDIEKDGETIEINRFFKCDEEIDSDWVELTKEEYEERLKRRIN